jgi:hypothetical protein
VETHQGELCRLDRSNRPATHQRKQEVYSQLLAIADDRGHSLGWVAHTYREFFGVWPRNMLDEPAIPTTDLVRWVKSQQIRFIKSRQNAAQGAHAHG